MSFYARAQQWIIPGTQIINVEATLLFLKYIFFHYKNSHLFYQILRLTLLHHRNMEYQLLKKLLNKIILSAKKIILFTLCHKLSKHEINPCQCNLYNVARGNFTTCQCWRKVQFIQKKLNLFENVEFIRLLCLTVFVKECTRIAQESLLFETFSVNVKCYSCHTYWKKVPKSSENYQMVVFETKYGWF